MAENKVECNYNDILLWGNTLENVSLQNLEIKVLLCRKFILVDIQGHGAWHLVKSLAHFDKITYMQLIFEIVLIASFSLSALSRP